MGIPKKIGGVSGGRDALALTQLPDNPLEKGRGATQMVPPPTQAPTPPKAPAPQKKK